MRSPVCLYTLPLCSLENVPAERTATYRENEAPAGRWQDKTRSMWYSVFVCTCVNATDVFYSDIWVMKNFTKFLMSQKMGFTNLPSGSKLVWRKGHIFFEKNYILYMYTRHYTNTHFCIILYLHVIKFVNIFCLLVFCTSFTARCFSSGRDQNSTGYLFKWPKQKLTIVYIIRV